MSYVSLALAKNHLNIEQEYTELDDLVEFYVASATETLAHDIHRSLAELEDSVGNLPPLLQHAILLQLGTAWVARETVAFGAIKQDIHAYDRIVSFYRDYSR